MAPTESISMDSSMSKSVAYPASSADSSAMCASEVHAAQVSSERSSVTSSTGIYSVDATICSSFMSELPYASYG